MGNVIVQVPVGRATLGRIINVIGEAIDERGDISWEHVLGIHREAPSFVEQGTEQEILETGMKVVDLLAPYQLAKEPGKPMWKLVLEQFDDTLESNAENALEALKEMQSGIFTLKVESLKAWRF